jgi:hypothetical protein
MEADLVGAISDRLLSLDVAEYRRFRDVCKPWRDLTDDPRAEVLDRRFRPRKSQLWLVYFCKRVEYFIVF